MGPLDLLEPIEALLKLLPVASSKARLLSLLVFAECSIATTPTTGRLSTIAFNLMDGNKISIILERS